MAKSKKKYYVVWKGRKPGIYDLWKDCQDQISGFPDAEYKSFKTRELAKEAFKGKSSNYIGKQAYESKKLVPSSIRPIINSVCVDAACSNNPGVLEYQGVDIQTKEVLFKRGPFEEGTVNIGEFLAIVDGIKYMKENKRNQPIYSDSSVAIKWVKDKKYNTKLEQGKRNKELFDLLEAAMFFLLHNKYDNEILKWQTADWGEIPADFGRK